MIHLFPNSVCGLPCLPSQPPNPFYISTLSFSQPHVPSALLTPLPTQPSPLYLSWESSNAIKSVHLYFMSLCPYVFMYICLYVCMSLCILCSYVLMYVCLYVSMHVCPYVCMSLCFMSLCLYVPMFYVSMFVCPYVSIYVCPYVPMFVCSYVPMSDIACALMSLCQT